MARKYLFADEAGCFTFKRAPNISKYFIICTVTLSDLNIAADLVKLRRKLVWEGREVRDYFHATEDKQEIRDQVFAAIRGQDVRIQATICEKAKAKPSITKNKARFYKYPWYYQFKHSIAPHISGEDELLITAASIGNKKERATFCRELDDVMSQTVRAKWAVDFRPSQCDPCLQVADYCAWAIQRRGKEAILDRTISSKTRSLTSTIYGSGVVPCTTSRSPPYRRSWLSRGGPGAVHQARAA